MFKLQKYIAKLTNFQIMTNVGETKIRHDDCEQNQRIYL